jgi:hypothetical protein
MACLNRERSSALKIERAFLDMRPTVIEHEQTIPMESMLPLAIASFRPGHMQQVNRLK